MMYHNNPAIVRYRQQEEENQRLLQNLPNRTRAESQRLLAMRSDRHASLQRQREAEIARRAGEIAALERMLRKEPEEVPTEREMRKRYGAQALQRQRDARAKRSKELTAVRIHNTPITEQISEICRGRDLTLNRIDALFAQAFNDFENAQQQALRNEQQQRQHYQEELQRIQRYRNDHIAELQREEEERRQRDEAQDHQSEEDDLNTQAIALLLAQDEENNAPAPLLFNQQPHADAALVSNNCQNHRVVPQGFIRHQPPAHIPVSFTNFLDTHRAQYGELPNLRRLIVRIFNHDLPAVACDEIVQDLRQIAPIIQANPHYLEWMDNRAALSLAGCVNQPLLGLIEIFAWVQVAAQPTVQQKIEAAHYLRLLSSIKYAVSSSRTAHQSYIPEIANALLRHTHEQLVNQGYISRAQRWLGVCSDASHLDWEWGHGEYNTVNRWMTSPEARNLQRTLLEQAKQYRFQELRDTVFQESLGLNIWGAIAYPQVVTQMRQDIADARDVFCGQALNILSGIDTLESALEDIPANKHQAFREFFAPFASGDNAIGRLQDRQRALTEGVEHNISNRVEELTEEEVVPRAGLRVR